MATAHGGYSRIIGEFMKKYILYLCAIFIMIWLLALPFLTSQKQYDMEIYQTTMEQVVDIETMPLQDQTYIRRYYQLQVEDYEDAIVYATEGAMDVEEIAIIQGRDKAQCDRIEQQLLNRIKHQKQSFAGYGVEQMKILENAQVKRYAQTIILIITKQPNVYLEAIEQIK